MTLTQIRSLTTRKAGRNNRSMLEHLLRIEELLATIEYEHITREEVTKIFQQYKSDNQISTPFTEETIQEYLRVTSEQKKESRKEIFRGFYTGTLIEQIEGDSPIIIDLQGNTFNYLARGVNTERHITIQNTNGDWIGSHAGSYHGSANIHFKNINGNHIGIRIGHEYGNVTATFKYINGSGAGTLMGSYNGRAKAIFENIDSRFIGMLAGYKGKSTIVAHNTIGPRMTTQQHGIFVLFNANEAPIIDGITDFNKRREIETLIAQNATPQEILDYIEANK